MFTVSYKVPNTNRQNTKLIQNPHIFTIQFANSLLSQPIKNNLILLFHSFQESEGILVHLLHFFELNKRNQLLSTLNDFLTFVNILYNIVYSSL